jgi:hypothetical protein
MSEKQIAEVYYQKDFTKYGGGSDEVLRISPRQSVFILSFCYDPEIYNSKEQFCDQVFKDENHVAPRKLEIIESNQRQGCAEVQHTSMSIGDYIVFEDGEIWIVDTCGWKVLRVVEQGVVQ